MNRSNLTNMKEKPTIRNIILSFNWLSCISFTIMLAGLISCAGNSVYENHRVYFDEDNKKVPIIYDLDLIKNLVIEIPQPDIMIDDIYNNKSIYYYLKIDKYGHFISCEQNKFFTFEIDSTVFDFFSRAKFNKSEDINPSDYSICIKLSILKNKIHFDYGIKEKTSNNSKNDLIVNSATPDIIGGFKALQERLEYPQIAKELEVQVKVTIQIYLDEDGMLGPYYVLESPLRYFTESALDALYRSEWRPAKSDGRPIGDWITIPFYFVNPTIYTP